MGRRKTQRFNWSAATVTPTKTAKLKLVVHAGKLIAIKVTPAAARVIHRAAGPGLSLEFEKFGRDYFTLANEKAPMGAAFGEWLGARVYFDLLEVVRSRMKNGAS
jgi:hypothetical protein